MAWCYAKLPIFFTQYSNYPFSANGFLFLKNSFPKIRRGVRDRVEHFVQHNNKKKKKCTKLKDLYCSSPTR